MASALQAVTGRLGSAFTALQQRLLRASTPVRRRLNGAVLKRHVSGDPAARVEHLELAAALGGAATVAAILKGTTGLVASPVVWDAVLFGGLATLTVLVAANGYWRGGLAAAYALFLAPVAGATVGTAAVGQFTGSGFAQWAVLVIGAIVVPAIHAVGLSGRRLRGMVR